MSVPNRREIERIRQLAVEVNAAQSRVHETFLHRDRDADGYATWSGAARQFHQAAARLYERIDTAGLKRSDPAAVEDAITFLEADPIAFRTGYLKEELLDRLKVVELSDDQSRRTSGGSTS